MEFEVLRAIPEPIRKAARRILPASAVDGAKSGIMKVLYERGRVQQEPSAVIYVKRHVLHTLPRLYHLEVKITDHCNLRCHGCTNFSNITQPGFLSLESFDADFKRLSELMVISNIFLLGGEPLLHPRLADFTRVARKHFPKSRIYVFTNCLILPKMDESIWEAFAKERIIVKLDDYPVKIDKERIESLSRKHGVKISWTTPRIRFFRVPIDLEGAQDKVQAFNECTNVDNCPNIKDGRLYPCGRVANMGEFQQHYGVTGLDAGPDDSMSIYDEHVDPWQIIDFLTKPIPWCSHCDYDSMYWYDWRPGKDTLEDWTTGDPNREVSSKEPK